MEQKEEDKLIAKIILFSGLTTLAVLVWSEVMGMEIVIVIVLSITSITLRRYLWKHYHT